MGKSSLGALAAVGVLALSAATAWAQYTDHPFIDATVIQSQARAFELAGLRLTLAELFPGEDDDDFKEQIEGLEGDFARFGGTLASLDANLAEALDDALDAVAEAVENGEDATALIAGTRELLAQAYDAVIDPAIQDTPAFKGAVLTNLLLGEPGVAEGYEEAGEEPWAFSMGWAALQRAKELWGEIAADADEEHRIDGDEMIAVIEPLFPNAEPPTRFIGNPEEAEAPAQRLVGILEVVVDADLYPGRDHAALADHLAGLTTSACTLYADGNDAVGAETVYAVAGLYGDHLGELVNLFDPEVHEEIGFLLGGLVQVDDDDAGSTGEDDDDDDDREALAPLDSCEGLIVQLQEVRTVLGG